MWIIVFGLIVSLLVLGVARIIDKPLFYAGRKPRDPNSLTHDAITTILTDMGHPEFDGVCYGFTLNWAASVADGHEELFYKQLRLLRAHQTNLPTTVKQIATQKQGDKSLTKRERRIETIPRLLKKMCIAQEPLDYKKQYGKLVWQPNIPIILRKITSKFSSVRRIFYKTHTFDSKAEANAYFNLLKNAGINDLTAVVISTDDHAMGFKLAGPLWRFIDINGLFQQQIEQPYYEFTSEQLVNELYALCLSEPQAKRLTVNTDFIAGQSCKRLSQLLNNVYPIFPFKSKITYAEKISFFAMAAWQGDIQTVKQCLKAGWSILSHEQLNDSSPLLNALTKSHRAVVQVMVSWSHYPINKRRKSDGFTLLHLACKYGRPEIVGDLLKVKGIRIDAQDKQGRTPLMIACKATIFTQEKRLFEQLFAHGASLTIKDRMGLTALDHAIKHNHQLAAEMLKNEKSCKSRSSSGAIIPLAKDATNKAAFFYKKADKAIPDDNRYLCFAKVSM